MKVYKYDIEVQDAPVELDMPTGAQILHVDSQYDRAAHLQLWALVRPDAPLKRRSFVVHGTGHEITESGARHVGTTLTSGGALVWHVFETT